MGMKKKLLKRKDKDGDGKISKDGFVAKPEKKKKRLLGVG